MRRTVVVRLRDWDRSRAVHDGEILAGGEAFLVLGDRKLWEAQFEHLPLPRARFSEDLLAELRCLVCQNQTIADSNADLAKDLRREVRDMLVKGKSDEEIKDFMLERYGDFVLYNPPVKTTTVPLWIGPFVLLAIGLVVVVVMVRRRGHQAQPAMKREDAERARKLLDDAGREQQS